MPQLPNHLSALPDLSALRHVANELPQPNPQSSGTEGPGLGVGDGGHSYSISCLAFWFCFWVVHQYVLVPSSMQDWNEYN